MFLKINRRILIYIFITAFILRIASLVAVGAVFKVGLLTADHEYGIIARSLMKGNGYSVPLVERSGGSNIHEVKPFYGTGDKETFSHLKETIRYRPSADQLPFYPLVLALIYSFSNGPSSFWVITFLQAIFSSATCIIIYLIALKLFNQRVAMIAGFIAAFNPSFILATVRLFPETFFTFWLALSILYLINLKYIFSLKHHVITGILIGISLLNSNVVVPIIPFIVLYMFLLGGSWKVRLQRIALVMATAFIIISPWLIRNYFTFNAFPLMKSTMGLNLWLGNNPKATGTFFLPSGEPMESILPAAWNEGFNLSETAQDKIVYDDVSAYIKEKPAHYAQLFLKRLYYFAWFPPDILLSQEGRLFKRLFKLPYGLILVSGMTGIFLAFNRRSSAALLLCAIMLGVAVLYSVFIVGNMRYRVPVEPYLIIFSSYAISFLADRYIHTSRVQHVRKKQIKTLIGFIVAFILISAQNSLLTGTCRFYLQS